MARGQGRPGRREEVKWHLGVWGGSRFFPQLLAAVSPDICIDTTMSLAPRFPSDLRQIWNYLPVYLWWPSLYFPTPRWGPRGPLAPLIWSPKEPWKEPVLGDPALGCLEEEAENIRGPSSQCGSVLHFTAESCFGLRAT